MKSGQAIVVHSKLLSFGFVEGGAETVFKALIEVVGPTGTLVFPTYTLNLDSESVYDPATTPAFGVGALGEYVRKLPRVIRSYCPIHSHCAIGPLAEKVVYTDPSKSMGAKSSFAVMKEVNFSLLLLGCNFQEGATFLHHVVSEIGVPYRSWIALQRSYKNKDKRVSKIICPYYGHIDAKRYKNNLSRVQNRMKAGSKLETCDTHFGESFFVRLGDLYDFTSNALKENPYVLVDCEQNNL